MGRILGNKIIRTEELDQQTLSPNSEMLSLSLASAGSQRGRRIKLGQELRKRHDAVIAGWRINVSDIADRHGCWHYHLEAMSNDADNPAAHENTADDDDCDD